LLIKQRSLLTASFQDKLDKTVSKCQTITDSAAA